MRGAKRRGNPYFRQCKTKAGLLRLRLAMTVGRLAMTRILVIARSEATWQSTPPPSLRGAKRRGNPHPPLSLRGAKRRGNPYFRQCKTKAGLLRLRLAMTVGGSQCPNSSHCEERSDVAIHTPPRHCEERSDVAIHTPPSLRGAKRRGNPHPPLSLRGAKRRGNPYSGGARRKLDCFACGSQ